MARYRFTLTGEVQADNTQDAHAKIAAGKGAETITIETKADDTPHPGRYA